MDAQTIFKYNIIKKKNPKVNIVTELISEKNLEFLLDDPLLYRIMKDYDYDQTPTFASGQVYLSSLMDSLICQAYFNPALITVLNKLIVGDKTMKDSGGVGGASKGGVGAAASTFIKDGDFSYIRTSNLYHYSVPQRFYGLRYKSLFKYLVMSRSMIPLGIYRTERVSFRSLDPSYEGSSSEDEEGDQANIIDHDLLQDDDLTKEQESDGKKEIKYVISNPDKEVL